MVAIVIVLRATICWTQATNAVVHLGVGACTTPKNAVKIMLTARNKGGEIMRVSDEQIISAMLSSANNRAAAAAIKLSERSFYERTRTPEFQKKLSQVKADILKDAVSRAESRLSDAVQIMGEIMTDPENGAQTRLNAAEALIRQTLKLIEVVDVARRLDEVEQAMKEWEKENT